MKVDGRWRVTHHLPRLVLINATFKVYENARQRVVKSKRKLPHAFVIGELHESEIKLDNAKRVRYNPFVNANFYLEDGTAVGEAPYVSLTPEGVFINAMHGTKYAASP